MASSPPHHHHLPEDLAQHLEGLDGFVDDLMSLSGETAATASSTVPRPSNPGSPTLMGTGGIVGNHSPDSPDPWRLANAVHMELQENAKLPTFHWTVDRSGSTTNNKNVRNHQQQQQQHDESTTTQLRPRISNFDQQNNNNNNNNDNATANDLSSPQQQQPNQQQQQQSNQQHQRTPSSLMEAFLSCESRAGLHANYAHAGALKHADPVTPRCSSGRKKVFYDILASPSSASYIVDDDHHPNLETLAALSSSIDPTPLDEICRRHTEQQQTTTSSLPFVPQQQQQRNNNNSNSSGITTSRTLYVPRHTPLPIPTTADATAAAAAAAAAAGGSSSATTTTSEGGDSNSSTSVLVDAAATAAAVALQDNTSSSAKRATVAPTTNLAAPASSVDIKNGTKQQYSSSTAGRNSSKPAPQHSAAHSVSRPALQNASKQHSQYGFGRKHVVPSVPQAPRPGDNTASNSMVARKKPSVSVSSASAKRTASPSSRESPTNSNNGSSGAAYERKKQRAKDARIKLNEAIDRLSIAMNMAGTQSKQRASQFDSLTKIHHAPSPYTSAAGTMRILLNCVETAEDAKKWDRPSFVGTAATLVQGLNAQCEALMRELHAMHDERVQYLQQQQQLQLLQQQQQQQQQQQSGGNSLMNGQHASLKHDYDGEPGESQKRRKLESINGFHRSGNDAKEKEGQLETTSRAAEATTVVFSERKITEKISSFLEPVSILRCMRVSRAWKDRGVFSNEPLWQNLAVERFGFYNVRQWRGKLDDEEAGVFAPATVLYKKMDAANVMPHFRQEGIFLLGEARLPGKVSAWTFLVERSNGETMRSVLRQPHTPGNGMYMSIPVVQLWTVIQNTGIHDDSIIIREQTQSVDASTRRSGEELKEIEWDERFRKRILNLDGSAHVPKRLPPGIGVYGELCRLRLYDTVILETNIHAKGCSTTSKFVQRSNFTKILVQIRDGITVPLVIPFPRDASHLLC